jgi:flagellar basal-body rod protein FlgB
MPGLASYLHHNRRMLDPLAGRMEQYLNLLSTRQKLVAANVANADTPGFRTKDIDFQFEFMSQMGSPDPNPQPHVIEAEGLKVKNDGNNVSVDREMRLLSETALRFQFVGQLLRGQISQMRMAIKDGGR